MKLAIFIDVFPWARPDWGLLLEFALFQRPLKQPLGRIGAALISAGATAK